MKIKRYLSTGGHEELPLDEEALIECAEEVIDAVQLTETLLGTIIYEDEAGNYHKLYIEVHDDVIEPEYAASYLGLEDLE